MTDTTHLPTFTTRSDADGFIVYVPGTGGYFHANAAAHDVLSELRKGRSAQEVAADLAVEQTSVAALAEVLTGLRERLATEEGSAPRLVPLADVIGSSADRCETFGMPL